MIFGLLTTPSRAGHPLPHLRVLLLNSYHAGYEWSEDVENAIRMHCNQAFLRMVGKEQQSVVGLHCWELVHYNDSPVHNCPFARMLESGLRESTQQQMNGRWLEVHVEPIFDHDSKLYGAIHIIADITERKLAELDRQALISQLEDRNAELERFAYSVSHDLKTPLVTIGGFGCQLKDDLVRGDRSCVAADIDFIESSAAKMGTLLNNVLHLARSGRIVSEPFPIDLRCIIQEALLLATGLVDSSTTRIELAEDLPQVYGDPDRLREVFQNLIDNAVKFSKVRKNPEIEIGGRLEDNQVVCWVRDNGEGIPHQYLEKIFGLFESLNHTSQGTGMGLTLARRIVEKHGGKIWAESAGEGQGSCFYLTLPICYSQPRL